MMIYFVYILCSLKTGKKYIGYTNNIERRLKEHNRGTRFFDRINKPFELLFAEKYETRIEAVSREKFLKSGKGRKEIDKICSKMPG